MIKPNKYLFEEIQTDPSYLISHLGIPDSADGVDVVRESCCGYGQGNPARGSPGRDRAHGWGHPLARLHGARPRVRGWGCAKARSAGG